MRILIINKMYRLTDEGYLIDPGQWDEEFSTTLLKKHGIQDMEWVTVARAYYLKYGVTPLPKPFTNYCARQNMDYNKMLLTFGSLEKLCELSGLPKPWGCGCR